MENNNNLLEEGKAIYSLADLKDGIVRGKIFFL